MIETKTDITTSDISEPIYHLCFHFRYGRLDNSMIWIMPPSGNFFHINQMTLRIILELNSGSSITTVSTKYAVSADKVNSIVKKFSVEKAIVSPNKGKITNSEYTEEDISLIPIMLFVILLGIIQLEYLKFFAKTYFLNNWYDGILVGIFAVIAVFFHELGHYIVAINYFKFKPKYGFTFLFIFPAIYVDTQYAWTLPRNKRLLINASGCIGDLMVNTIAVFLAVRIPAMEYYITPFILTQYTRWSVVLNPLFSGDGYWILSDLLKTVNLTKKGFKNLFRLKINFYSFFGLLSLAMMIFSLAGIIWYLVNLFRGFVMKWL